MESTQKGPVLHKEVRRTDNEDMHLLEPLHPIPRSDITQIAKSRKVAVYINTHLPAEDPRDISARSIARFKVGIEQARSLRQELGRANVIVIISGGWPLYNRLPLAVHHAYAAIRLHNILQPHEVDAIFSYGVNTITDLHGSLKWMKENILGVQEVYVASSKGHASRLIAESGMDELFDKVFHTETHEPRGDVDEDHRWILRSRSIPAHQYMVSGRGSDVTRFGSMDSLAEAHRMELWAKANPTASESYINEIWGFLKDLEEHNVIIKAQTPGCWRISINC